MQDLIASHEFTPQDIAVLYRTNAQSRAVEDMLMKANMNYQVIGGLKFYERKEIKDLLAYLRLITNPDDDISFERVVNVPKRGVGAASVEKLRSYDVKHDLCIFQVIDEVEHTGDSKRAQNALIAFQTFMSQLIRQQDFLTATDMVEQVLEQTNYEEMLKQAKSLEAQSRLENRSEERRVGKECRP